MWFSNDIAERLHSINSSKVSTPEMKAKQEAEKLIEEAGRATCMYCEDEIWKNTETAGGWIWESESMVGYCETGYQRKHKPLVKYSLEDGVINA